MAGSSSRPSMLDYFKKGSKVEISSNDPGFRGSLYTGTVVLPPKHESSKVTVEYETLMAEGKGKRPLRETLSLVDLRPSQPPEKRLAFDFSDEVDAFYNDGWWEGVITHADKAKDHYKVFFRGTREELDFAASQLRLHREWVKGLWVPPFDAPPHPHASSSAEAEVVAEANDEVVKHEFKSGDLVEASSNEEGFEGAWFAATILEKTSAGKYLIEYQKLKDDEDTGLLREEVDEIHLRPYPPDVGSLDGFRRNDEVDALYNDGWWVGVISRVRKNGKYNVYFKNTNENLTFKHSDLRVHQEWRDGKWHTAS